LIGSRDSQELGIIGEINRLPSRQGAEMITRTLGKVKRLERRSQQRSAAMPSTHTDAVDDEDKE
jgi:hypothetical protein